MNNENINILKTVEQIFDYLWFCFKDILSQTYTICKFFTMVLLFIAGIGIAVLGWFPQYWIYPLVEIVIRISLVIAGLLYTTIFAIKIKKSWFEEIYPQRVKEFKAISCDNHADCQQAFLDFIAENDRIPGLDFHCNTNTKMNDN